MSCWDAAEFSNPSGAALGQTPVRFTRPIACASLTYPTCLSAQTSLLGLRNRTAELLACAQGLASSGSLPIHYLREVKFEQELPPLKALPAWWLSQAPSSTNLLFPPFHGERWKAFTPTLVVRCELPATPLR